MGCKHVHIPKENELLEIHLYFQYDINDII